MKKTAILIHGFHLQAPFWEEIMWGTKEHKGRILRGIEESLLRNAELIVWGSGAFTDSEMNIQESKYIFDFTEKRLPLLASLFEQNENTFRSYLEKVSSLDTFSENTKGEIQNALTLCKEKGIEELYLVSSPTHISRCLLMALLLKEEMNIKNIRIYAAPSDSYSDIWKPEDVVVFEPPHRSDRAQAPTHLLVKRFLKYQNNPERANQLFKEISEKLDSFEDASL